MNFNVVQKDQCVLGCAQYQHTYRPKDKWREIWRRNLGVPILNKSSRVCDKHFSEEMFATPKRCRLNPDAYPMHRAEESDKENNLNLVECGRKHELGESVTLDENCNAICLVADAGTQTCEYLRNNTPKKFTLKQRLNAAELKLLKMEEVTRNFEQIVKDKDMQILFLEGQLDSLRKEHSNCAHLYVNKFCQSMSVDVQTIVANMSSNLNRSAKGNRYSTELKIMALSIHFTSPVTYRLLKSSLNLPSVITLRSFISCWPKTPGNIDFNVKSLELKVGQLPSIFKYCSISADEMSLKSHLDYSTQSDTIIGMEDFGADEHRAGYPSHSVLVLMALGIAKGWKHPLAYYFVRSSCTPFMLKRLIFKAIRALQNSGLFPVQFVCDQGSNFRGLAKLLDISPAKPYFEVENKQIFFFFDSPHLIKSTRNCLLRNEMSFQNSDGVQQACWKDIAQLYSLDSKFRLRLAPKLTDAHILPNNFQRMKVKYASQVLSSTVSAGLLTYYSSGHGSKTMISTANFLQFFDSLFDVFNSSSCRNPNKFKVAFNQSEMQLHFLRQATDILKSMKVIGPAGKDIANKFHFLKGWLLNISALMSLWQHLEPRDYTFILTRRLNQDCLEQFFGEIRSSGGNNRRITPWQFTSSFQKLWGLQYLKIVKTGNCQHVESEALMAICNQPLVISTSWLPSQSDVGPTNAFPVNLTGDINATNFLEENSFIYVCGWLFRKCYESHTCNLLLPTLDNAQPSTGLTFTMFKQFQDCNLIAPPIEFVEYIRMLEEQFCSRFLELSHVQGVSRHLSMVIKPDSHYACCENLPERFILDYFIRVRIHFLLRFWNRNLSDPTFRNKLLCVAHL